MRRRKKNGSFIKTVITLLVLAILAAGGYIYSAEEHGYSTGKSGNLQTEGTIVVNYFDVGQGDSEFIQLPDGKCILIDAGVSDSSEKIAEKIRKLGYEKIDYLVATHPHADHIGGMQKIVESFEIGEIYMPRASTDTRTFEKLLQAIADKGLSINTVKAGAVMYSGDDLSIEFIAPISSVYKDLNNYSAVVRLQHGENVFLFMGDAEKISENEILQKYSRSVLDADVLKVGHHGSNTASTADFINCVAPDYAIIEVGVDNSYHHPHAEAINNLNAVGAQILRTDINGDISIVSDKTSITVYCEKD